MRTLPTCFCLNVSEKVRIAPRKGTKLLGKIHSTGSHSDGVYFGSTKSLKLKKYCPIKSYFSC